MMRLAFSTVACPEWTIEKAFTLAEREGFEGIEFRSMGYGGAEFACEPGLTGGVKIRRLVEETGVDVAGLATGLRFDRPVWPPVAGYALGGVDKPVMEVKPFVALAVECGAPTVRVFAFETPEKKRAARLRRRLIVERLKRAADTAHNMGVRLLLENGGSFPRGADVAELLDEVDSMDLAACYSSRAAARAGERPEQGVKALGRRLVSARVKDVREGRPCALGEGDTECRAFVEAVKSARWANWLVFEWDRAWVPGLASAEHAVSRAARTLYEWMGAEDKAGAGRRADVAGR